ncbi:MAG: DNA mismatch repair protein MutT [Gammaproteobacteria bacterium HGW-Gammaproteobacteria-6]|nr:MAG: DNA mismatch repair protein MutT [Gammaproteobacteria bacterium HGW-Gammaproteobacteria-6]
MGAEPVHVSAAVMEDAQGRVLLARRSVGRDLAGAWEFPGGKREPGETPQQALCRELREELGVGVEPEDCSPLIRVPHAYPHKRIVLDVYRVSAWQGKPHGREGQALAWTPGYKLGDYAMPAADLPVIAALMQPERYLLTPATAGPLRSFADELRGALAQGARRIQLRMPGLDNNDWREYAHLARDLCADFGAGLLLNADVKMAIELGVGVHLRAAQLSEHKARPLPAELPVAASCHNATELAQAQALGVDFVVLGPVQKTASHPGQTPLGWAAFARLRETSSLPIYAIGGMTVDDFDVARQHGAQGIAGIRALWPSSGDLC